MAPASRPQRYPLLDLGRVIAALMVVFYHWCFLFNVAAPALANKPWPELSALGRYGYLGVNLFFLISGFLIVQTAYGKTLRGFLRARIIRLWPAYLACCVLTFAVTRRAGTAISSTDFLYNLTMLNGVIDFARGATPVFVDGVYWTLAVEWTFYAITAAIIATRQLAHVERWLWVWVTFCVGDAVHPVPPFDILLLAWGGYFVAGAAFYRGATEGWDLSRAGLVAVSFSCCAVQAVRLADDLSIVHGVLFDPTIVVAIIAVLFLFFGLVTFDGPSTRGVIASACRTLGGLSYPIYLLHQQIGATALARFWSFDTRYVFLLVALLTLIALSAAVHFFVERPVWAALRRQPARAKPR